MTDRKNPFADLPPAVLRPGAEDDLAEVRRIADAAFSRYLDRMPIKPFPMLDDYAAHIREGRLTVLEAGGRVLGYLVLKPREDSLLLDIVAVDPAAQGRGYGRILAAFAEKRARELGLARIAVYTNEAMRENVPWYLGLGYAVTHRIVENGYRRIYFAKDV